MGILTGRGASLLIPDLHENTFYLISTLELFFLKGLAFQFFRWRKVYPFIEGRQLIFKIKVLFPEPLEFRIFLGPFCDQFEISCFHLNAFSSLYTFFSFHTMMEWVCQQTPAGKEGVPAGSGAAGNKRMDELARFTRSSVSGKAQAICGAVRGTFYLKAVSEADAIGMAILTKDFSPLKMLPQVADAEQHSAGGLHSAWISGLVGIGIRSACSGREPLEVEIMYLNFPRPGEELILNVWEEENPGVPGNIVIVFEVGSGRRGRVAEGLACLEIAP
jgi:hypothetical protein